MIARNELPETLMEAVRYFTPEASEDHLSAYVDEQVFRFNHRKDGEWPRFKAAMRHILGARLTYSELTDGAVR